MAHGLALFYVKYLGNVEVTEARGNRVVDLALHEIIANNKGRKREGFKTPRIEFSVTSSGIKLTDR